MTFPTYGATQRHQTTSTSYSYTLTQGANLGLIGIKTRDLNTTEDPTDWGGAPIVTHERQSGNIQQSFSIYVYSCTDLTDKVSDTRSEPSTSTQERDFGEILIPEAIEFVASIDDEKTNSSGYDTHSVPFDAGADDALVLGIAMSDHGADWSVSSISNGVYATVRNEETVWYGVGYGRLQLWEIPGGAGELTYSCGMHGDDTYVGLAAFKLAAASGGGGGGCLPALFPPYR